MSKDTKVTIGTISALVISATTVLFMNISDVKADVRSVNAKVDSLTSDVGNLQQRMSMIDGRTSRDVLAARSVHTITNADITAVIAKMVADGNLDQLQGSTLLASLYPTPAVEE